ncbi:MAG: septum formation protein Maf [Actinobacteria bacterium]|nr:MAG: septum formation protein Maf [Actinomycetota bacterium]
MLVLASASPRRREILTALGIPFEVVVPDVEELRDGRPEDVVVENARRKAAAGLEAEGEGALTLGVDTEVILDGRLLGKAAGPAEARERLEALAGRTHTVLSGVVLYDASRPGSERVERSGVARSEVTFRELDEATLETYVASGEWRDRAGAYAIQGLGSILVERVEGDFSNVVGLPVRLLLELAPELLDPA